MNPNTFVPLGRVSADLGQWPDQPYKLAALFWQAITFIPTLKKKKKQPNSYKKKKRNYLLPYELVAAMASSNLYIILVTLAIFAPSVLATEYVVGDDKGWTINFDYQAWAQGKVFYVGDNLVFNYPKGAHTVLKVNGTGFQQCAAPLDSVPLTSGKDVINLATPGRKWYICGVGQHCELGNQKLLITIPK